MADEKTDQPFGGQIPGTANGKDVLYGWLVGRAAADLGLAQAIAASEAQRAEQIRRLEEALMGQMRELQNSQTASSPVSDSAEVGRLKDQVEQFSERQNFLEAQQLTSGQLEAQLAAKIHQFESQLTQTSAPMASHEVIGLRQELASLTERMAQAESAARPAPSVDHRQIEEQIGLAVREQSAALQSQLLGQLQQQSASVGEFTALAHSWQHKLDQLQQEIHGKTALLAGLAERVSLVEVAARQTPVAEPSLAPEQIAELVAQLVDQRQDQAAAGQWVALESSLRHQLDGLQSEVREKAALVRLRDNELGDLQVQLAGLAQRLDQLTAPTAEAQAAEREVERAQWQREFDERLTLRLRELGDEIRGKLQGVTSAKVDQEQFRGETLALTARIAQLEQANQSLAAGAASEAREAHQATLALRAEIASLKSAWLEQQRAQPSDATLRNIEESLRGQILEVRQQLGQNRGQEWEGQFSQLRGDLQTLMQRQVQAETLAKQTHALVTQETAQLRGGLKADLVSIEGQLNERRSRDAALQGMEETLHLRMRELHSQLAQGMLAQDQRDSEFRELKAQLQTVAQQVSQASHVAPVAAPQLGSFTSSLQTAELRSAPSLAAVESMPTLLQPASASGNGQASEPPKLVAVELHDRLSAEIERKRAELREKSGRWKVRQ